MSYRWKPSKSQRRQFAENMKDPGYAAAYYGRKEAREAKRRSSSKFDYASAGGEYVPTQIQYEFCINHMDRFEPDERNSANMVISAWVCQDKVHHDHIHIVNDRIREYSIL
jgi:hypothetical protein